MKNFFYALCCAVLAGNCGGYNIPPEKKTSPPIRDPLPEEHGGGGSGGGGGTSRGENPNSGVGLTENAKRAARVPAPVQSDIAHLSVVPFSPRSVLEFQEDLFGSGTPVAVFDIKNLVREDLRVQFVFETSTDPLKVTWEVEVTGPKGGGTLQLETKTELQARDLTIAGIGSQSIWVSPSGIPELTVKSLYEFPLGPHSTVRYALYGKMDYAKVPEDSEVPVTIQYKDDRGREQIRDVKKSQTVLSAHLSGNPGVTVYVVQKDGNKICVYR